MNHLANLSRLLLAACLALRALLCAYTVASAEGQRIRWSRARRAAAVPPPQSHVWIIPGGAIRICPSGSASPQEIERCSPQQATRNAQTNR